MKTVYVLLVAACFVACARGFPSLGFDSSDEDDFADGVGSYEALANMFTGYMNRLRERIASIPFWSSYPDPTDLKIPEGANTTSTTKIIDGHVVTINETTYSSGDDVSGAAFRIRIIDIRPQNSTNTTVNVSNVPPATVKPEVNESRETVEDFNNEISKNTETLTA